MRYAQNAMEAMFGNGTHEQARLWSLNARQVCSDGKAKDLASSMKPRITGRTLTEAALLAKRCDDLRVGCLGVRQPGADLRAVCYSVTVYRQ
jgi:hypothetical protein